MKNDIPERISSKLSILKDAHTSPSDALFSAYSMSRYNLVFENLKIKFKDVESVMDKLLESDKDLVKYYFPISIFYDFYVLESDKFLITFDSMDNKKKVMVNLYYNSYTEVVDIFEIIKSFEDVDDKRFVSISSYFLSGDKAIKSSESTKVEDDFNYNSDKYYPYIDLDNMFKQFEMSDGNILLLCGVPGTGKTKLGDAYMKYMLENYEPEVKSQKITETYDDGGGIDVGYDFIIDKFEGIQVAYIKNEEILARDEFWNDLKENEFHLVFLDDLDYGLLPRTQQISSGVELDKNKFISNLLSFTDGIFESGNKTKFIITTNRSIGDIDTAVLRKGRTFDILELRELNAIEAEKVWTDAGLTEDEFYKEFKSEKILQADLGSAITMAIKAKERNIELKPYIKEEGISLYSKSKKPVKIGL